MLQDFLFGIDHIRPPATLEALYGHFASQDIKEKDDLQRNKPSPATTRVNICQG